MRTNVEIYLTNSKLRLLGWTFLFTLKNFLVGSIYRPLDCMNFFEVFPWLMENIWKTNAQTLSPLGDFNVNLLPSLANSGLHHLNKFNLKNVINTPTRIDGNSSSLIGLIITSVGSKITHHGACNLGISDHHLIYAVINLRRTYHKPALKVWHEM